MKQRKEELNSYLRWMVHCFNKGYARRPYLYIEQDRLLVSPPLNKVAHVPLHTMEKSHIFFTIPEMIELQKEGLDLTDMTYKLMMRMPDYCGEH